MWKSVHDVFYLIVWLKNKDRFKSIALFPLINSLHLSGLQAELLFTATRSQTAYMDDPPPLTINYFIHHKNCLA